MGSEDEVRLAVPARPEFVGLARVTAAGLASRLGFTFDQVEDLRLAIDEMCFGLTGSKGRDGILEVRFLLSPEGLTVNGEGHFSSPGRGAAFRTVRSNPQRLGGRALDKRRCRWAALSGWLKGA